MIPYLKEKNFIIEYSHIKTTHLQAKNTEYNIQMLGFYWYRIKNDIMYFIKNKCLFCIKHKYNPIKKGTKPQIRSYHKELFVIDLKQLSNKVIYYAKS